jgi:hypothetical protein
VKKSFRKCLIALACAVGLISGLTAEPAFAQAAYNHSGSYSFQNGCVAVWQNSNGGSSTFYSSMRNAYNHTPVCWIQMKVSYWNVYGTWIIWDSGWIGATSQNGYFPFTELYGQQAIWWVDYNTNWGGNIWGSRDYAPGCNINGC